MCVLFRYIIDGIGSRTVFNGPKQLVDELYTRANQMVAGWNMSTYICF